MLRGEQAIPKPVAVVRPRPDDEPSPEHPLSAQIAESTVFVAVHSFLALGLAISLGPVSAPTLRQRALGLIFTLCGIILSAFQLALPSCSSPRRLVPKLLLPFWVCLTGWVFWPM